MKIAIIGTGNVGTALGKRWLAAGHEVCFGVRNPQSDKSSKALAEIPGAILLSIEEAAAASNVIVVTIPAAAVTDVVPSLGEITSKTIIDATNAIGKKPVPYNTAFEAIKKMTGATQVVKCFNSTGFENMQQPVYHGTGIDMFAAGDSVAAKEVATQLAKDGGFENCYNFGGDDKVELLESFALSWINLAIMQGYGRDIAFKVIRR